MALPDGVPVYFDEDLGGTNQTKTAQMTPTFVNLFCHDMHVMWRRLNTFKWWPLEAPQMTVEMAIEGFFYIGIRDIVQCFLCEMRFDKWTPRQCPATRHQQLSPSCPMATGGAPCPNVPYYFDVQRDKPPAKTKLEDLQVFFSSATTELGLHVFSSPTQALESENSVSKIMENYISPDITWLRKFLRDLGFAGQLITRTLLQILSDGKQLSPDIALDKIYKIQNEEDRNTIAL